MTIVELRAHLAACEKEGRNDTDFGLVFIARSSRGLGVRPKLLAERENGDRVYSITVAQLRRMIAKASL